MNQTSTPDGRVYLPTDINEYMTEPWIDELEITDRVFGGIFLVFVITLSLVGNALVIAAAVYSRKLREHISTVYIVNLSITDVINALLVMPFATAALVNRGWNFGAYMCNVHSALNYCCIIVSMLTLAMIAIDRYLLTCKQVFYTRHITRRVAVIMVLYSWIQGIFFAVIPVALSWVIYDRWEVVCAIDWNHVGYGPTIYVLIAFTLCFAIPVIVIFAAYIKIYRTVSTPVLERRENNQQAPGMERKILVSIIIIVAIFLVCMTPFCVTKVIKIFINKYKMPGRVNMFATLLQFMASATNPLVYGIFRRDFRVIFKRMVCFKRYAKVESIDFHSGVFSISRGETNVPELVITSLPEHDKDKITDLELAEVDDGDLDIFAR